MRKLSLWRTICVVCVFCAVTARTTTATPTPTASRTPNPTPTPRFTVLAAFSETDGSGPFDGVIQATTCNFYGTTREGGNGKYGNGGTVFEVTPGGIINPLYSFCSQPDCTDGALPTGGLVQASNGNFYGVTQEGGANRDGTVFEMTSAGKLTTVYSFCSQKNCTDGMLPHYGLVQASNGNLYGSTTQGGANGSGTVFKIAAGKLTTIYNFCSQPGCTDGADPEGTLIQATNGNLYGETSAGGSPAEGTVFEMTTGGKLTTVYNICSQTNCPAGADPVGGLVQATNGDFYGTTNADGKHDAGTIFELTAPGKLSPLYNLCSETNCADGATVGAALVQATDGNFYGVAGAGGSSNAGTLTKLPPRTSSPCSTPFAPSRIVQTA